MPHPQATPILIPLPIKGIDQGSPETVQPEGTCPNAQNVRAFNINNRLRISKRDGYQRAFPTMLTGTDTNRVLHLSGYSSAGAVPSLSGGEESEIDDNFKDLASVAYEGSLTNFYGAGQRSSGGIPTAPNFGSASTPGHNAAALGYNASTPESAVLMCRYATTNSIEAYFSCNTLGAATSIGVDGSCHMCGLLICADAYHRTGYGVRLARDGSTIVRVEIVEFKIGSTPSIQVTDDNSGSGYALANSSSYTDDLYMKLELDADQDTITATIHWDSQSGTDANWAASTGIVVTASIAGDMDNDYSANMRSGAGYLALGDNVSSLSDPFKFINRIVVTKVTPASTAAVYSFAPTDPSPGNNFFIPAGLTSVSLDESAETANTVDGEDTQTAISNGDPPYIDDSSGYIDVQDPGVADDAAIVTQTTEPSSPLAVRSRNLSTSGINFVGFCARVNDSFDTFIEISVQETPSAAEATNNRGYIPAGNIDARFYVGGDLIYTESSLPTEDIVFAMDDEWTMEDNGTSITIRINGITLISYTPDDTPANGDGVDGPATLVGSSNRTGLSFYHNGSDATCGGGQWFVGDTSGSVNLADATTQVVAFTKGKVYTGNIDEQTITEMTGSGLTRPLIDTAILSRKIYAVDGFQSKVIDPSTNTVTIWTADDGTLPEKCRLICTYRGRIVLARQESNPSAWYMSRVLDALDWEYGATPVSTSAVAGTNADVGQPSDPITALIPFSDDFLIFGCSNSIWMMEGDPGYGGQLQNVSYRTGIVGARAWAFDHNNILYFMGQSGLFRIVPGHPVVEAISERRLKTLLGDIDYDSTFIQLAFDPTDRHLYIFLTPNDNSQGTHVVYDTKNDGFWKDIYPTNMQPWSVLDTFGATETERRFLIGGNDGYIRQPADGVYADDGEQIASLCRFAAIEAPAGVLDRKLVELQFDGDNDTVDLTWYIYTARSITEVNDIGAFDEAGVIFQSADPDYFQNPVRVRARGGCHQLELRQASATNTWAIERVVAFMAPGGRRRKGGL